MDSERSLLEIRLEPSGYLEGYALVDITLTHISPTHAQPIVPLISPLFPLHSTADLQPIADAGVWEKMLMNHGRDTEMGVGYGVDLDWGRSFIEFDLSGIPTGSTILSATLKLYVVSSGDHQINVHRVMAPWDEDTVTDSNQPSLYYMWSAAKSLTVADVSRQVSFDVTGLVDEWLHGPIICFSDPVGCNHIGPAVNYGLCLSVYTSIYGGASSFATRESQNAPHLVIKYTPPATYTSTPTPTHT